MSDNQVLEVVQSEPAIQPSEMTREEKRDYAKSRNILEVADALGVSLQKKGRNISWTEHPSFFVNPDKNRFKWFSQDVGGDPIALVQTITEKSYKEAVEFLLTADLTETEIQYQEPERKPFKYYLKDFDHFSLAREYLVNERKIDGALVDKLHQEGYLVQSEYAPEYPESNRLAPCVVAKWEKEGKVVGGTIQGLEYDTELYGKRGRDKRIMANVEKDFGFNYTIGTPNKIIFAESFIDLLSYWTLSPGLNDCLLVDLEGLKVKSVEKFFETLVNEKGGNIKEGIRIAVDNDVSGQAFVDKLSVYEFSEQENFILSMPDNLAVTYFNKTIYDKVGRQFEVDPAAIAAVHKAFVNGNDTNRLANPWKNDQFFGQYLKPKEKEAPIDVEAECRKAAGALAAVKNSDGVYDFQALTAEGPFEQKKMGQKIERFYNKYVSNGMEVKVTLIEDMNDMLKEQIKMNPDFNHSSGVKRFWYEKSLSDNAPQPSSSRSDQTSLDQYEPPIESDIEAEEPKDTTEGKITQQTKEEVSEVAVEQPGTQERSEISIMGIEERVEKIRASIAADQQAYEAKLVTLPPADIIQQSEAIVQRKMIESSINTWLGDFNPTNQAAIEFLEALESVEAPVTFSVPIINETPTLVTDKVLFTDHFPSAFTQLLKSSEAEKSASIFSEKESEQLKLLERSLTDEIEHYAKDLDDPVGDMRLKLQLDALTAIFINRDVIDKLTDESLVAGSALAQLSPDTKERQLVEALLENSGTAPYDLAKIVNTINQQSVISPEAFTFSKMVSSELNLIEQDLINQVTEYPDNQVDPFKDMQLTLKLGYLTQIMVVDNVLIRQEDTLVPGANYERLDKDSKGYKIATLLLDQSEEQAPYERAQAVNAVLKSHRADVINSSQVAEAGSFSFTKKTLGEINLIGQDLMKQVSEYPENEGDAFADMQMTLKMDYLSSIMVSRQVFSKENGILVPGENYHRLAKDSQGFEFAKALLEKREQTPLQLAQTMNEITTKYKSGQMLSDFKEWANTYDGIGKEYVPLDEINELEISSDGLISYEPANTWFDSVSDYLGSHKESNFGQSVAFTNAKEFVAFADNPNRDLIVMLEKVTTLSEALTDAAQVQENQDVIQDFFSKTDVSWARYQDGGWTLIPVPDFNDPDSSELLPVIVADVGDGKDARLFDNFTEYEAFAHEYIESGVRGLAIDEKVATIEKDLRSLLEWTNAYEGLDRDFIPKDEIQSLHVIVDRPPKVETERVYIADVIDGGYNRYYDSIDQFLSSFESNQWHDTMSHQSAMAYVAAQGEPEKQQYELTRQHVIALKDNVLNGDHSLPEEAAKAAVWDNIFVAGYEEWRQSSTNQMIYYQDPTRVGNPVYFDNEEKAQQFVSDLISRQELPDLEMESKSESRSRGFFRRERQDKKVVEPSKTVEPKSEQKGIVLPIPGLEVAEDKPDLATTVDKGLSKEGVETKTSVTKEVKENATTKDLIEQARQGAKDFLQSDKYKAFLKTMSNFHNYSWSNTMLIMQQMPQAKVVAGFQTWKKQFNRHVTKGQKGIKILAPVFTKEMQTNVQTVEGKKQEVEEEISVQRFKQATVFDVSQTEGDPLPTLVTELQGNVKDYSQLFEAIASTTDYKIDFEDITSGAKGYCHFQDQRIAIKTGMSEIQTIKTLVHEITHSQLHDPSVAKQRDRRTMEVEAESTAFAVCSHFNIDTSDYSFGYLATWGSTKEVSEITQSFATIQKQSDTLINAIHGGLDALSKEQTKGKGLTDKLENARHQSKEYNQDVKKSQAKGQTQARQKPEKEK